MLKLWSRGFRFQMMFIVSVLLLVPVLLFIFDIVFTSKTDDVLVKNLEFKLTGIATSMSKQIHEHLAVELQKDPGLDLPAALEKAFTGIAAPKTENYNGVRLGIYIVEQDRILVEGFLHNYRPPGGEGQKQREQRIYHETSAGIKAVVAGGEPITKLGQTWDDQFIEYLVPIYVNSELVAVVWAEERIHPIFAQSARARYALRMVTLIVFSFAIGATLFSILSLVRQVKTIKEGLQKLEKDLNNTLPELPGDLGQVTSAINKMATSLKEKEQMAEQLRASQNLTSLGRLVTDIAHELRNPICILQCTTDLIEPKVNQNTELNECVSMLKDQVKRLNMLTEELLDFGRPLPMKMEPFNLGDLLASLIDMTSPLLKKSQIELLFVNSKELPDIVGNKEKIKQVFINLIMNAIQAMPEGGSLTIHSFAKEDLVCVEVHDTGVGISEDDLPHIFKPFYTKKTGGSGLGLAICKRIIENHRGFITVESLPGTGAAFNVCFIVN